MLYNYSSTPIPVEVEDSFSEIISTFTMYLSHLREANKYRKVMGGDTGVVEECILNEGGFSVKGGS